MTDEQINQRIAEACGWKKMNWNETTVYGSPTHGFRLWESKHPDSIMSYKGRVGQRIPDYLNDLNAIHEAEKIMTAEQCEQFNEHLTGNEPENHKCEADKWWFHATARQRAEAFLKTLNIWKS